MANQEGQQGQTFQLPMPRIAGFYYGIGRMERIDVRLPEIHNVDLDCVEPNVTTFGNGRTVYKTTVGFGGREFLMFGWRVRRNEGVQRNLLLRDIRESTIFCGEVLVFVKGMTAQVPFLKYPVNIPKKVMEDAIGFFITHLLDALEGGRAAPNRIDLFL